MRLVVNRVPFCGRTLKDQVVGVRAALELVEFRETGMHRLVEADLAGLPRFLLDDRAFGGEHILPFHREDVGNTASCAEAEPGVGFPKVFLVVVEAGEQALIFAVFHPFCRGELSFLCHDVCFLIFTFGGKITKVNIHGNGLSVTCCLLFL